MKPVDKMACFSDSKKSNNFVTNKAIEIRQPEIAAARSPQVTESLECSWIFFLEYTRFVFISLNVLEFH